MTHRIIGTPPNNPFLPAQQAIITTVAMVCTGDNIGWHVYRFSKRLCSTSKLLWFLLSDVFAYLEKTLSERIMFLDGAMGTMVQRLKLEEADFRGRSIAC